MLTAKQLINETSDGQCCDRCGGSGKRQDQRMLGEGMRSIRERAGRSAKEVAAALGISAGFLCDMEYGRRSWSAELVNEYLQVCKSKGAK